MPLLLQSGSDDEPRRIRGRPRAGVSKPDETSRTEAIRAKNRRAQKAYRLRCKVCFRFAGPAAVTATVPSHCRHDEHPVFHWWPTPVPACQAASECHRPPVCVSYLFGTLCMHERCSHPCVTPDAGVTAWTSLPRPLHGASPAECAHLRASPLSCATSLVVLLARVISSCIVNISE